MADYFVQKRKKWKSGEDYEPLKVQMQHVEDVLGMLSAMKKDGRTLEAYRETEKLKKKEKQGVLRLCAM